LIVFIFTEPKNLFVNKKVLDSNGREWVKGRTGKYKLVHEDGAISIIIAVSGCTILLFIIIVEHTAIDMHCRSVIQSIRIFQATELPLSHCEGVSATS